jgi:hypothetical protein
MFRDLNRPATLEGIRAAASTQTLNLFPMNWMKLFVASLVSPLVIPAAWIVAGIYWGVSFGEIISGIFFVYVPGAFVIAILFGTPMFLLFRAFRIKALFAYMLGGFTIALLTALLIERLFGSGSIELSEITFWTTAWVLSASVFWLFFHRLNSEKPVVQRDGEI